MARKLKETMRLMQHVLPQETSTNAKLQRLIEQTDGIRHPWP